MADNNQKTVKVKQGQTLSGIAQREGLGASNWQQLGGIPENVQQDPTQLQPGTELTIPTQQEQPKPDSISGDVSADELSKGGADIDYPRLNAEEQFITGMDKQVENARNRLEKNLQNRKKTIQSELETAEAEREEILDEQEDLTEPFREDIQERGREERYINENFEENQKLVNEMESLLQEGNDLIEQQKEVTGLKAVRNPRIQKTMDDVSARVGVIESVINARNGQIQQAQTMIDRTINKISQDRSDRISYYDTLLNLNEKEILNLDEESKQIAQEQRNLIKGDLEMAEQSAQKIKEMLMDPATAELMGKANVKVTDTPQEINTKIADAQYQQEVYDLHREMRAEGAEPIADPSAVPDEQLEEETDSRGKTHYYKVDTTDAVSTSTMRILDGDGSLEDLTPSEKQEVENELYEAGLSPYRSDYTEEFKSVMEEIVGQELDEESLNTAWEEYRQSMGVTEGSSGGEETAGDFFSESQVAKGASNADMTIEEFEKLDRDEANKYIYGEESESSSQRTP